MIDLYNGDCLEIMDKLIADNIKVDAIITDPPYGTTACSWDNVIPFDEMWKRLNKLIKDNGAIVLFGSEPFSSALRMSNIKNYKYDWIWNKKKGGNIMNLKYQPYKIHENISVFNKHNYYPIMIDQNKRTGKIYSYGEANGIKCYDDERIYTEKYPPSIIDISNANQNNKIHPTQKPIILMEYLIRTYTLENETVLDFTMGSGTTGLAAKNTNRNFIGIELDKHYFNMAKERIENGFVQDDEKINKVINNSPLFN